MLQKRKSIIAMSYDRVELTKLLILSQQGDQDAFRQFLIKILPLINGLVNNKVFDKNNVNDVTQETLISIHKALATYDSKRDVLPWVLAITERRIVDYIRKMTRINRAETLSDDEDLRLFQEGAVTFAANESKLNVDAQQILSSLPEDLKKAIELTKIEGFSTKEAADILGIKENALRTRVSRGLAKLRIMLEKGVKK